MSFIPRHEFISIHSFTLFYIFHLLFHSSQFSTLLQTRFLSLHIFLSNISILKRRKKCRYLFNQSLFIEYVIFILMTPHKIMYMHAFFIDIQFAINARIKKNTDSSAHFLSHNFHIAIFALRVFWNPSSIQFH